MFDIPIIRSVFAFPFVRSLCVETMHDTQALHLFREASAQQNRHRWDQFLSTLTAMLCLLKRMFFGFACSSFDECRNGECLTSTKHPHRQNPEDYTMHPSSPAHSRAQTFAKSKGSSRYKSKGHLPSNSIAATSNQTLNDIETTRSDMRDILWQVLILILPLFDCLRFCAIYP